MARMLEIRLDRPYAMEKHPELGQEIFDVFRVNFGFAGPEYIQEIFKMGEIKVKDIISKWIFFRYGIVVQLPPLE